MLVIKLCIAVHPIAFDLLAQLSQYSSLMLRHRRPPPHTVFLRAAACDGSTAAPGGYADLIGLYFPDLDHLERSDDTRALGMGYTGCAIQYSKAPQMRMQQTNGRTHTPLGLPLAAEGW
jgi:hypothetical protein